MCVLGLCRLRAGWDGVVLWSPVDAARRPCVRHATEVTAVTGRWVDSGPPVAGL